VDVLETDGDISMPEQAIGPNSLMQMMMTMKRSMTDYVIRLERTAQNQSVLVSNNTNVLNMQSIELPTLSFYSEYGGNTFF
jgi:hypothetical protein